METKNMRVASVWNNAVFESDTLRIFFISPQEINYNLQNKTTFKHPPTPFIIFPYIQSNGRQTRTQPECLPSTPERN